MSAPDIAAAYTIRYTSTGHCIAAAAGHRLAAAYIIRYMTTGHRVAAAYRARDLPVPVPTMTTYDSWYRDSLCWDRAWCRQSAHPKSHIRKRILVQNFGKQCR
eukprot:2630804-Rhodomonas_salina.1